MTLREYQADFSSGTLDLADITVRPDGVVPLIAITFGPTAQGDTSKGLLYKAWYARADNTAGKVYLGEAHNEARDGWKDETELFSFAGDPITELDITTDQNGNFVVVAERSGHVWIYYYKPLVAAFVFEDFGAGRTPRCCLDDPRHSSRSDILVFYVAGSALMVRTQSDLYTVEVNTGQAMSANQYVEKIIRDDALQLHIIISRRDPAVGQYTISRLSSLLYPYYAEDEGLETSHAPISGLLDLIVIPWEAALAQLDLGHIPTSATLVLASHVESVGPDEIGLGAAVEGVSVYLFVIPEAGTDGEVDLTHDAVSGTLYEAIIGYTAADGSVDLTHDAVSGSLIGQLPVTTGLVAHHDAQAVTAAEGDTPGTWADESGNGHTLDDSASPAQPIFRDGAHTASINGHPCFEFPDGTTSFFQYISDYLLSGESAAEIFAVLKNAADPQASAGKTGIWTFSASDYDSHHPYTSGVVYEAWGTTTRKTAGNPTPSLAAMHLYGVQSAAGSYVVRVNGSDLYTTASNTVSFYSSGGFGGQVGKSKTSYVFVGWFGEIIIYNRILSTAERAAVESYLAGRWA